MIYLIAPVPSALYVVRQTDMAHRLTEQLGLITFNSKAVDYLRDIPLIIAQWMNDFRQTIVILAEALMIIIGDGIPKCILTHWKAHHNASQSISSLAINCVVNTQLNDTIFTKYAIH